MIISGGENVYSSEVENAIYTNPDVLGAAVIGTPDDKWGEVVTAVVVRKPGTTVTEDDVVSPAAAATRCIQAPRKVIFIDEMPQTVSGKIRKNVLRDQFASTAQHLTTRQQLPQYTRRNPCHSQSSPPD